MLRLNHAHFTVENVAALTTFLTSHFDFRQRTMRGKDAFAVLEGADGFTLALLQAKSAADALSRDNVHIGFFVDSISAVHRKHAELAAAGIQAGSIDHVSRAGFSSVTFYCQAPGGLLVEVSFQEPELRTASASPPETLT